MVFRESLSFPLELTSAQMRDLVAQAMERIVAHIESLPEQSAANPEGAAELARRLREPLPETGARFGELLDLLFREAIGAGFNSASPGYLAYVPGGGIFHAALADLIANAVNRYVGLWASAPGLVQLEANVVRWFCDIVGFPERAGGFLTSGGSLANFSALFTARRERLPDNFLDGTLYASDQSHHSVRKAAVMAGFSPDRLRAVASDDRFRLRLDALKEQIREDRRNGYTPFAVVANAGTTNTGAVDDLEAIAVIAEKEGLWLHVDAAYGGFFMLTERGRKRLRGIHRADSITLDPHKGLFLPYGTGCLIVRDRQTLKRAHAAEAAYLPAMQEDPEFVDFCQISPELSRDFRGLRVWLPLKMHGIGPFREALDEKLDLTRWAAERLSEIEEIEIVAEPQLSVVAFRLRRPGLDDAALDALNRKLLEKINAGRRVLLNGTLIDGRFVLRFCVLSFRTHRDRLEICLEEIRTALRQL